MSYMKCICCEKEIRPTDLGMYEPEEFEQQMWDGGTVDKLYMPYGSRFDGKVFLIAICDDCVEEKSKERIIRPKGEYI